jgi:4-amino-4-deoxy-L-arabinose transferase-like glycosyltransferase
MPPGAPGSRSAASPWRSGLAVWAVLLLTVLIRLVLVDQPIVENYVGRQVPTAMVARNLERGCGFLWPRLDTAPHPNYFMVEPPVYQSAVVGLRYLSGRPLGACGRIVSALATGLGAWGLFGLIRRKEGERIAVVAVIAFACFPITIRYGRAFQPDSLMLGAVLAGANCWDRARDEGGIGWRIMGWCFLAIGFAAKITSAVVLIPLGLTDRRRGKTTDVLLAASALVPVLLWYGWANHVVSSREGSLASTENRAIWLHVLGFSALWRWGTLVQIWRCLLIRGFTPVGFALACYGLCLRAPGTDRLDIWRVWAVSVLGMMALLAEKLHHEYYWLILAPAAAAGVGRGWVRLWKWNRGLAWLVCCILIAADILFARSTWQTPPEWREIQFAARRVAEAVPSEAWLVAPEPLLYQADRLGCRLEFTASAAQRAAAEWGKGTALSIEGPIELIAFYEGQGARFVADVSSAPDDARREALHEAIRRRYKVLIDDQSVIVAELAPAGSAGHVD